MKYTKEQLQAMSDFEVNKALCTLLGKDVSGICELRNQMTGAVTDYCNTPNDIMPLAFEYGVVINKAEDIEDIEDDEGCKGWVASGGVYSWMDELCTYGEAYFDENPLRAIACCLLMMELQP